MKHVAFVMVLVIALGVGIYSYTHVGGGHLTAGEPIGAVMKEPMQITNPRADATLNVGAITLISWTGGIASTSEYTIKLVDSFGQEKVLSKAGSNAKSYTWFTKDTPEGSYKIVIANQDGTSVTGPEFKIGRPGNSSYKIDSSITSAAQAGTTSVAYKMTIPMFKKVDVRITCPQNVSATVNNEGFPDRCNTTISYMPDSFTLNIVNNTADTQPVTVEMLSGDKVMNKTVNQIPATPKQFKKETGTVEKISSSATVLKNPNGTTSGVRIDMQFKFVTNGKDIPVADAFAVLGLEVVGSKEMGKYISAKFVPQESSVTTLTQGPAKIINVSATFASSSLPMGNATVKGTLSSVFYRQLGDAGQTRLSEAAWTIFDTNTVSVTR